MRSAQELQARFDQRKIREKDDNEQERKRRKELKEQERKRQEYLINFREEQKRIRVQRNVQNMLDYFDNKWFDDEMVYRGRVPFSRTELIEVALGGKSGQVGEVVNALTLHFSSDEQKAQMLNFFCFEESLVELQRVLENPPYGYKVQVRDDAVVISL